MFNKIPKYPDWTRLESHKLLEKVGGGTVLRQVLKGDRKLRVVEERPDSSPKADPVFDGWSLMQNEEEEALLNMVGGVENARQIIRGELDVVVDIPILNSCEELIPRTDTPTRWRRYSISETVSPSTFEVGNLRPRSVLEDGEVHDGDFTQGTQISFWEMKRRAAEFGGNWSLADGHRMYVEQSKLSLEFRDSWILLPGTVLRDELAPWVNIMAYLIFNRDLGYWQCHFWSACDKLTYQGKRNCFAALV